MKTWKIFLCLGIVILFIGIAVLIGGLAANGWKFKVDYEMQTFVSEGDNNSLDLKISAGTVKVEYYEGENFEIVYPTSYRYGYDVTEENGKITVAPKHSFGFWFGWFKVPEMTVKIPQGKVIDFSLEMSAGSAHVQDGEFKNFNFDMSAGSANIGNIRCDKFDADLSAGSLHVSGITCDNILIDLSAGSANLTVNGKKSDYYITVDKSAGSCNVSGQQGAASGKVIDIDLSAGSVNVHFTD